MQTAFAKYEGAGNDFILIDNREGGFTPRAELIAALCDRHFGIGADGLMTFARQPHTTDFRITVPGGALAVRFSHEQGTQTYTDIRLTGPARRVFEGVFDSENF